MSDGLLSTVHHDPRTGDEGPSTSSSSARQVSEVSHHTTEPRKPEHDSPVKSAPTKSADPPFKSKLPSNFLWIPANWTWSKLKPVIRCALAGWVSVLLMVIQPVLRTMGQVCYTKVECRLQTDDAQGWLLDNNRLVETFRLCHSSALNIECLCLPSCISFSAKRSFHRQPRKRACSFALCFNGIRVSQYFSIPSS